MSSATRPLDVLMIAGFFPPHAPLAATRAPALARFLLARGHRVRVLAARNEGFTAVADHGLPADTVTWAAVAPLLSVRALARLEASAWRGLSADPRGAAQRLFGWPDPQTGWRADAIAQGRRLIAERRPDVILATVPPHTGLLVAEALHRRTGVPWVAEFRDLWVDHPYYDASGPRKRLDVLAERRALSTAAGLVTVTDGWRRLLAEQWPNKPARLARNGFEDGAAPPPHGPMEALDGPDVLSIVYAGVLYGEKRDPRPLFAALALLDEAERARVRVHFYGSDRERITHLAAEHGLAPPTVTVHDAVPRDRLMALQRRADLLLLLRWNDPREDHVLAGKLFEYIGCRRPILSVGSTTGEAAAIIRDGGLGLVSHDPDELAAHLRRRLREKDAGGIPPLPEQAVTPHARGTQFTVLEDLLAQVAEPSSAAVGGQRAPGGVARADARPAPPRSA